MLLDLIFAMRFILLFILSLSSGFSESRLTIKADKISYDKEKNIYNATGRVEVLEEDGAKTKELYCDELIFEKDQNKLIAIGSVYAKDSEGNLSHARYLDVSKDFSFGKIDSLSMTTKDQETIKGRSGEKINDQFLVLKDANYTPCKLCHNEKPFWSIKAKEIIHDKEEQTITYYHATLTIGDIPVFYTPYFFHPDPSVKRRSGLIKPRFGYQNDTGVYVGPSYYYVIDDYSDMTISPYFFQKDKILLASEYRKNFKNGTFFIDGSLHKNKHFDKNKYPGLSKTRWHLFSKMEHDIDSSNRLKLHIKRASDTTYLTKYPMLLKSEESLISSAEYEHFYTNQYTSIKGISYQTDTPLTTPFVLPKILSEYDMQDRVFGGYSYLTFYTDYINRRSYTPGLFAKQGSRSMLAWNWSKNTIVNNNVITYNFETRFTNYIYKEYDPALKNNKNKYFKSRLHPIGSVKWGYPLIHHSKSYSYMVEPQSMIVAAPYLKNNALPLDDSSTFTFDDTTIFLPNRFDGYNRTDGGIRLVYGIDQSVMVDSQSIQWFCGQTRRLDNHQILDDEEEENTKYSNIVNAVRISPHPYIKIRYRNSYDPKKRKETFQEIGLSAGKPILRLESGYVKFYNKIDNKEMRQLNWQTSSKINDHWSVSYGEIRNFRKPAEPTLNRYVSAKWENDCFSFSTYLYKTSIKNNDVSSDKGIMFELSFKNLGMFSPVTTSKYENSLLSRF